MMTEKCITFLAMNHRGGGHNSNRETNGIVELKNCIIMSHDYRKMNHKSREKILMRNPMMMRQK